jgi:hypothetical protein
MAQSKRRSSANAERLLPAADAIRHRVANVMASATNGGWVDHDQQR